MNKTPIKEVYDKLSKEELGTGKSKILFDGIEYLIVGLSHNYKLDRDRTCSMVEVMNNGRKRDGITEHTPVEWIGDKPESKMLYACLCATGEGCGDYYVMYHSRATIKTAGNMVHFKQWLPEDQYPPVEEKEDED